MSVIDSFGVTCVTSEGFGKVCACVCQYAYIMHSCVLLIRLAFECSLCVSEQEAPGRITGMVCDAPCI